MRAAYQAFHERDLLHAPTDFLEGQRAMRLVRRAINNGCRADASLREFDAATDLISELGEPVPPLDPQLTELLAQCERLIAPTLFD